MPTRPPSRHQDRPDDDSQPSSESASESSSPEPAASINLRRDGSPNENIRRLYNILHKPISSSPPESTAMPNSALKPRHHGSRSPSRSRSASNASLQVTPGVTQPPPANSYQQPLPQPPSNVISRASDAAMAIEKSQKEKALKEKERREHRKPNKDVDGDRVRPESDRTPKKQSSGTSVKQISSHHSGVPASPHRDTYTSAQPANNASQKTSGTSASGTLGRSNSVKVPAANHSSQRDGSTSHPPHPFRHGHGPGSNKTTSGTAPIAV
ncbi:hypothetical protein JOM56_009660 [Amanita muscaria]